MEKIRLETLLYLQETLETRLRLLNNDNNASNDPYIDILNSDKENIDELLKIIVISLPNYIYQIKNEKDYTKITNYIIDDFILFIAKENISSDNFNNAFEQYLEYLLEDLVLKHPTIFK